MVPSGIPEQPTVKTHSPRAQTLARLHLDKIRRKEQLREELSLRRKTILIINPGRGTTNGLVATRMVESGEAEWRKRGTAIWIKTGQQSRGGVDAGSLKQATLRELRRIPVVNARRLLGIR